MSDTEPSSRTLSTWADWVVAIDEVISRANRTLELVDRDLRLQGWDTQARADALRRAIHERGVQVRFALSDTGHIASEFPRVFNLLKTHGHKLEILRLEKQRQPAESVVVADGQHSLFRPISVQPRGIAVFENRSKSIIYSTNFKVLWEQGGRRLFPESLGL